MRRDSPPLNIGKLIERNTSQKIMLRRNKRWAEVFAEDKKDEAILKKIDAARDKISDCLGIPRQLDSDPLNLDTPTPTP
jgi:hypothetical protein